MEPTPSDLETLRAWWAKLQPDLPHTARGLWFGITELQSGGAYRSLYIAGCPTYDPDDPHAEWATEYCWWPADRYVTLADFAALPDQPYGDVLTYAAELVRALDSTALPTVDGAAVGFDDGDFVII